MHVSNIIIFLTISFVETFYECVRDYFSIDPILLKLFAHLTPKENFTALCERVPPYLSIEVLVRRAITSVDANVINTVQYLATTCRE